MVKTFYTRLKKNTLNTQKTHVFFIACLLSVIYCLCVLFNIQNRKIIFFGKKRVFFNKKNLFNSLKKHILIKPGFKILHSPSNPLQENLLNVSMSMSWFTPLHPPDCVAEVHLDPLLVKSLDAQMFENHVGWFLVNLMKSSDV